MSRRVIAIGAGEVGKQFVENLIRKEKKSIDLVGFIDDDKNKVGYVIDGVKVLGTIQNLHEVVEVYNIDEIYLTIESISYEKLLDLIQKAQKTGCQVNLISSHYDVINRKVDTIEYKDFVSVPIYTKISPFYTNYLKRALDLLLGSFVLFLITPVLFIFAFVIKLSSGGPVFYKTCVIGKNGKKFVWYKLRSMVSNDNRVHEQYLREIIENNKSVEKIKNDHRITPIGKIIRKYSIDEMPQLFNVIKGDMSLVGPRPCLPYEFEQMKSWQRNRFKVAPGLTGLWQIFGRNRFDVNFNDSVIMDLYYADNISLWFDLKILLKTIPIVIFGKGGK